MKKKSFSKIVSALCAMATMAVSFSSVQAATIENVESIDAETNYIIYSESTDNALYDSGGYYVGWLQKGNYSETEDKYTWKIEKNETGYYLKNLGTNYYVMGNEKDLDNKEYVVSDKTGDDEKGSYLLQKVEGGYKLKSVDTNKYMRYGENANYITFTEKESEAAVWQIEAETEDSSVKPAGSIALWQNPRGNDCYRIPAIATTNDGTLLAVNDLRYGHENDLGNHQIDVLIKSSEDNGKEWSEEVNLTEGHSKTGYGFGDAAMVADRNSDKVLILAATGSQSYPGSTKDNPIRVSKLVSEDGGKKFSDPIDITEKIYGLNDSWTGIFAASGRIMQSRYVKVGEYYRIYTAILSKGFGNYVLYSDDFGDSWNILGDEKSPVPNVDEAKVEELPNGDVIISSRTGSGRFVNVFSYDENDKTFKSGQWEESHKSLVLGSCRGTNGETYIVYAKDTKTGEYKYLALQSIPSSGGNTRQAVGIYYKALNGDEDSASDFVSNWDKNNFYLVQGNESAYSTMSVQADGKLAFLYEDRGLATKGYDTQFLSLDLETITNGQYTMAFKGIGSKETPYVVETEEQAKAVKEVFGAEEVNWVYKGEAEALAELNIKEEAKYIIYSDNKDNTLYDSSGRYEGWLQQGVYVEDESKYLWDIEKTDTGYYLKNSGTSWYVKANVRDLYNREYVVSDKSDGDEKGSYVFEKVEGGYILKSVETNKYMSYGEDRRYVTFTNNSEEATVWQIEELRN